MALPREYIEWLAQGGDLGQDFVSRPTSPQLRRPYSSPTVPPRGQLFHDGRYFRGPRVVVVQSLVVVVSPESAVPPGPAVSPPVVVSSPVPTGSVPVGWVSGQPSKAAAIRIRKTWRISSPPRCVEVCTLPGRLSWDKRLS